MWINVSELFWDIIDEELVCWLSPGKISKDQSVKMPLGLPISDSLPVTAQHNLISAPSTTSTSTASTISISKENVFTSVCDNLLVNPLSTQNDHSKTIDLVVVSTGASTQAGQFSTTTTSSSSTAYKLCEIVSREKDLLFKSSNSSEVELEPARDNVFSVRRRNRQFFTVTEEDENESDSDHHAISADKEKTVKIDPLFNLGDSLKKLYFPHDHQKERGKRERKVRTFNKKRPGSGDSHGYESDPEGKVGLYDIVKNDPELKSYKSHPELNLTEKIPVDEPALDFKSKSLPTTPRVSPKLLRRNSLTNSNKKEVQQSGPGFSFLASVAGELHKKRKNHDKQLEKGIKNVPHGQALVPHDQAQGASSGTVAVTETVDSHQLAKPQTGTIVDRKELSGNMHTHHVHDFSESTGIDLESHSPLSISSLMKWGTTKKIKITNKESNMFSPTSF